MNRQQPFAPVLVLTLASTAWLLAACGGGDAGPVGADRAEATAAAATVEALSSADADRGLPLVGIETVTGQALDTMATVHVAASANGSGTRVESATVANAGDRATAMALSSTPVVAASDVAPGAGFFVDAVAGNDANPGSFDQPWKTLSRLTTAALPAGQSIYLRCGSTWRESVYLSSKNLGDGAKITGYGPDCATKKPIISGANDFSGGWTRNGNVWSRKLPAGTPKIKRLFIDSAALRVAQWPKYGGVGKEYAFAGAASHGSSTLLAAAPADVTALAAQDVVGATVQLRSKPWLVEPNTVAAFAKSTGQMTLATTTRFALELGNGYVLQDKVWMLRRAGEYVHDTATDTLYVFPTTAAQQADLNASKVEGSVRDVNLTINGRPGVVVSGIATVMARQDGLSLQASPAAVVDGIESRQHGSAGVIAVVNSTLAFGQKGAVVRNSSFTDNWRAGIDVSRAASAEVTANTVLDTGNIAYSGMSEAGIFAGSGAVVDGNTIKRSIFRGIRFTGIGGSKVSNNVVANFCTRLVDCAGIYWRMGEKSVARVVTYTSSVVGNTVSDAVANTDGAVGPGTDLVAGIYLDDYSQGVTVSGNAVRSVPYGIYLHNASYNQVDANKVWFATRAGLRAQMDQTDGDFMVDNRFTNNQLVPTGYAEGVFPNTPTATISHAIWFRTKQYANPLPSTSNVFSGNQIVELFGSSAAAALITGAGEVQSNLTASGWRTLMNGAESVVVPATYALYQLVTGPELLPAGSFDTGLASWKTFFASSPAGTARAVNGEAGCTGTCAAFTAMSTSDQLYSTDGFQMVPGALHVARFTAGMGGKGAITAPFINRLNSPWTSLLEDGTWSTLKPIAGNTGDVLTFEAVFRPTSSEPARISLRTSAPGVAVHFDSVSIKQIIGYQMGKMADWSGVVAAPAGASTVATCAKLGWPTTCKVADINGNPVTLPRTVPANTAQVFLRVDSSWRL